MSKTKQKHVICSIITKICCERTSRFGMSYVYCLCLLCLISSFITNKVSLHQKFVADIIDCIVAYLFVGNVSKSFNWIKRYTLTLLKHIYIYNINTKNLVYWLYYKHKLIKSSLKLLYYKVGKLWNLHDKIYCYQSK